MFFKCQINPFFLKTVTLFFASIYPRRLVSAGLRAEIGTKVVLRGTIEKCESGFCTVVLQQNLKITIQVSTTLVEALTTPSGERKRPRPAPVPALSPPLPPPLPPPPCHLRFRQ